MKKHLLLILSICLLLTSAYCQKSKTVIFDDQLTQEDNFLKEDDLLKQKNYKPTKKVLAQKTNVKEPDVQNFNYEIEPMLDLSIAKKSFPKNKSTKGDGTFVSDPDSLVLVTLYNSTNGDNWTNKTNWLTGPVDSWFGIDVNGGLVTSIHLIDNNLVGTITSELGQLTSLTSLYLDQNQLTGEIPSELGNLNNLAELSLWINQLSGSIPPELGNLTSLTYIDLDENQLSGTIPTELGNLTNLTNLWLDVNQLSGNIPAEIGNLAKLEKLGLAINQLTGNIPVELGNLSNLNFLGLYDNQLTGVIPTELTNLSNLGRLYLFTNQLTGTIPKELGSLNNLTTLWLYSNKLSGSIPSELGNLSNLETLYLQGNQLIGTIPTELSSLSNLTRLYLGNNQLTGSIPSTLGTLSLLERLDFQNNQLTGAIPTEINNLNNLFLCYFGGNSFNELPPLTSTNIQYFYINENEFTFGDFETSGLDFSALAEVTYSPQAKLAEPTKVDNGNNTTTLSFTTDGTGDVYQWYKNGEELTGETTNTITVDNTAESFYYCFISNPTYLDLVLETEYAEFNMTASHGIDEEEYNALVEFYNSTNGTSWSDKTNWLSHQNVSEWYGITATDGHITAINLSENNLSGTLPTEIGVFSNLITLNLDHNAISGEIPAEIGNLSNLAELNLWINKLTGNIPTELGNLTNLTVLDIGYNQLTGVVPSTLGALSNLEHIWLNDNQLDGEIPLELGNLSNLQMLGFSTNQFSGEIPSELGNLNNLIYLSLFSNSLTGTIPVEIGALSNLTNLYLHDNQLAGSIPVELGNLTNLQILYLYTNKLTGSLPIELQNCIKLTNLIASTNQLSGTIPAEIGNISTLQYLSLRNNQFTGTIPAEIGNLSNIYYLSVSNNMLQGDIPTELGNLTNLQSLYLDNNNFTNGIDLSGLSFLAVFTNNQNKLTFGDLENYSIDFLNPNYIYYPQGQLQEPSQTVSGDDLILSFTTDGTGNTYQWYKNDEEIVGEISNELTIPNTESGVFYCAVNNPNFANLTLTTKVVFINSSGSHGITQIEYDALVSFYNSTNGNNWNDNTNWLSAEDVETWKGITVEAGHVIQLKFVMNGLTGSIPSTIGDLTHLQKIDIQENEEGIAGPIPAEIGNLSNLAHFRLYKNSISGSIPTEIGDLNNLELLDLRYNDLEGSIPDEIGNLSKLSDLNLYSNKLSGNIPTEIGNLTSLDNLTLAYNNLGGELPSEIGNLINLNNLFLHHNNFEGSIPSNLENLDALTDLELQNNNLDELADLSTLDNLNDLRLDNNNLTFEDFETTILDFNSITTNYSPQQNLFMVDRNRYFSEGRTLILNCNNLVTEDLSCETNQFAIYKDGVLVKDWSTEEEYIIASFTNSHVGVYTIQVKNPNYPNLILYSDELTMDINNIPSDITLSSLSISEGNSIGETIGNLSTTDDIGDTHTYSLTTGDGSNDSNNSDFTIEDNMLKAAVSFDFETQEDYNIYLQTKDADGLTCAKAFIITVTNNNEAPTDINLSGNSIDENSDIGSIIGQLSTTDVDHGDTFTYTFVSGDGSNDSDNASFTIDGNKLKTATELDYESKDDYKIYIQTEDASGLSFGKAFVISINDVDETTGVYDLDPLELSIYPNPSNGAFAVEYNSSNYQIKIYDVAGSVVYNQISKSFKHEININNISSGTYFVTIIDNGTIKTQKLMIK